MKFRIVITMIIPIFLAPFAMAQGKPTPVSTPTASAPVSTSTGDTAPKSVERVEVIGSRIKRIATEGPSAVKTIAKEKLEDSANITLSDSLRDSTAATFGVTREAAGSGSAATSNIGLHGLGADKTLVLLNGHRLPKDPSTQAVDLNLIPESAIERIEVLKDGASALYGSDALGGVINIVTKQNFVGNEVSVKYSTPQQKGGGQEVVSLISGSSSEKSDLLTVLNYSHTDVIYGRDRALTKDALSEISTVGTLYNASGTPSVPLAANCPPGLLITDPSTGGKICYYKYNEQASLTPAISQIDLLTDYNYRINSNLKFYNRNLIVFKDIYWNYAPTPVAIGNPVNGAPGVDPTAGEIDYRFGDAGNRINNDTERNYSTLFGLKGNITDTWEYDLSAGYSRIQRFDLGVSGYLLKDVVGNLISTGAYHPFSTNPGSIVSASTQPYQKSTTDLLTADLVFTGEVGQLEAGPIGAAVGLSEQSESIDEQADAQTAAKNVYGSSGAIDNGSRDIISTYAELSFPVTSQLELDIAGRYDHYSDFGSTFNPKLSAKYTIDPSLLLRASVGTGFKAPALSDLYGAVTDGYQTFIDRYHCAQTGDCQANQYHVVGGGNRDLKQEKALTGSLGTVYEPSADFNISLDGWYTHLDNVVGIDFESLTEVEEKNAPGQNTYNSHGVTVQRDNNGKIQNITAPNLNLESQDISGLDIASEYGILSNLWGDYRLSLTEDLSYLFFYNQEGFPGSGKRDVLGEWGFPRWRNTIGLELKDRVVSYSLDFRTIPGQNVEDRTLNQKIPDLTEADITVAYHVTKDGKFTAGVKNVFDTNPPADMTGGPGGSPQVNTDLYDINKRKFFAGYSQRF